MKKDLIFCIGYNKTGTTSLYQSIVDLGFISYPGDMMGIAEFIMADVVTKKWSVLYDWIDKCIENNIEVVKDIPFSLPGIWEKVYEKYPNATYILSERDSPEQWYNSIYHFHQKGFPELKNKPEPTWEDVAEVSYRYKGYAFDYFSLLNNDNRSSLPYDKETLINSYLLHNNSVKDFFKDKDNFISVNVANHNDYFKLCSFLEVKPTDNKFLRLKITNDSTTWDTLNT